MTYNGKKSQTVQVTHGIKNKTVESDVFFRILSFHLIVLAVTMFITRLKTVTRRNDLNFLTRENSVIYLISSDDNFFTPITNRQAVSVFNVTV